MRIRLTAAAIVAKIRHLGNSVLSGGFRSRQVVYFHLENLVCEVGEFGLVTCVKGVVHQASVGHLAPSSAAHAATKTLLAVFLTSARGVVKRYLLAEAKTKTLPIILSAPLSSTFASSLESKRSGFPLVELLPSKTSICDPQIAGHALIYNGQNDILVSIT